MKDYGISLKDEMYGTGFWACASHNGVYLGCDCPDFMTSRKDRVSELNSGTSSDRIHEGWCTHLDVALSSDKNQPGTPEERRRFGNATHEVIARLQDELCSYESLYDLLLVPVDASLGIWAQMRCDFRNSGLSEVRVFGEPGRDFTSLGYIDPDCEGVREMREMYVEYLREVYHDPKKWRHCHTAYHSEESWTDGPAPKNGWGGRSSLRAPKKKMLMADVHFGLTKRTCASCMEAPGVPSL